MAIKICILSSVHIALDNRVFYREACSLQRAGYDVTLIAVHDREEIKDGVRIVPLPRVPRWQRPLLWREVLRLALAVDAHLYLFHDPELLLPTPLLRWQTGRPTVYDVHEVNADFIAVKDYMPAALRYPAAWAFGWLEPLLARLQSGLIFADDQIAQDFAEIDVPKTTLFNFPAVEFVRAATLTLALPTPGREQSRGERGPEAEPVVLYLGGMERNRGSALMVEAFARVLCEMPAAQLLVVGHFMPPDLEQEVADHAARLGIADAVTLTGRVPFETIGRYLQQAAVGWVTWQAARKNQRNIPTKLFEYMAYGLPVVSSDLPSTQPFVHDGVNGYRVRADDPTAHAAAILALLRDPGYAARLGRAGRILVQERWNWQEMEKRLLRLVEELISVNGEISEVADRQ